MASLDVARVRRFTAASLLILGLSTAFAQRLSSADPTDQETAKLVSKMIPKFHLSRTEIDDKVSGQLLDGFIKDLDPQKLYFLKSDIADFEKHRNTLDDEIKAGNVSFCYEVFDRYKKRLDHQMGVAHQLVSQDHDFTANEAIEIDAKKLTWCATQEELDERWRKRVKYDLLQFKLDGGKDTKDAADAAPKTEAQILEAARERLNKRYRNNQLLVDQYSPGEELEIFLTALASTFDPHSTYMSPHSWEDFEIQMRLSLDGIGAALRYDDGYTVVASIVPGGAASEEGNLKVGDKIIGVGQDAKGEIVDIFEMKLSEVVRMIRGPRGTIVRLQVKPADGGETKLISLTRKKIELKESEVKGEIIDCMDRLGRPGKIGVVSLPSYYRDFAGAQGGGEFKSAAVDVGKVLDQFEKEGVDVVIVDQRNNGGGALTEAIEVSGHFIDRGPVVQVKEPTGHVQALDDREPGVKTTKPLVVIDNRLSASASEIFSGVIKDYKRGIIVGDTTTHGKGTVQNLMDVAPRQPFSLIKQGDRGKLKLTIQQFYRVNGDSTQNRGVRSDVVLPSVIDHWDLGEASLDHALPFDQVPAMKYSDGRMVSPELVSALQKKSEARIAQNSDFQTLNKAIERYLAKKDRTQLTLNEAEARKERAEDEVAKKETEALETGEGSTPKPGDPIFPKRFYEDEVLNIALDYLTVLQDQVAASKTTK
ncbi:carboxy terminal-processing peptidase [Planctomicrobium piriforme]|uniref:Carboxyl-terminal processing protease n=1 Tax=Planctomicrobium piriforme TaxID=1576369 RepID=A0A1I3J239_9PLAN|nr:carboxy terminal-processing peptidase [Planctomicrobium piriforme]SFI54270.1 carboxyl-terminal processing protease [Planctomicrobium piriforme]